MKTRKSSAAGERSNASKTESQPASAGGRRPWKPGPLVIGGVLALVALSAGSWGWKQFGPGAGPSKSEKEATAREVDRLLRRAEAAAERGDSRLATRLFDDLLEIDRDHAQGLLYRGQLAREAGDDKAAAEYWARIPDKPPQFGAVARFLEGVLCVDQGRAREAEKLLRRSIRLNPEYLAPRDRLVRLYVVQMRRDDVRRELLEIRRLRPWDIYELVLFTVADERISDLKDGIAHTRRFVASDAGDIPSLLALGRYLMENEQLAEAEKLLAASIRRRPEESRIRGLWAESLLRQNKPQAAAAALAGAAAHASGGRSPAAEFWRSCGWYWKENQNWKRAAECFGEGVRQDPENLALRQQLGLAQRRAGDEANAQQNLKRAELLDRMMRQAYRIRRREERLEQMLLPILVEIGGLLTVLDRPAEAVWWYEEALSVDPNSKEAKDGLAQATLAAQKSRQGPIATPDALVSAGVGERWPMLLPEGAGASSAAGAPTSGTPMAPGSTAIRLKDHGAAAGLDHQFFSGQTGLKYLVESMGGGVAVIDYDRDRWPDLYFTQGSKLPFDPNEPTHFDQIYRHTGDGRYVNVTANAGIVEPRYGQGVAAGDYDNDGFTDIFVSNFGRNVLYRNNGDGTFTDITEGSGITGEKWSASAAFADLDRDGDLDLFVARYVDSLRVCRGENGQIATCDPQNFGAEHDSVYLNRGDGGFSEISEAAGILVPQGKGLGVVVADFNEDQWPDIYVANDGTPNFMFQNRGGSEGPRFDSVGLLSGTAVSEAGQAQGSMGIACADLTEDGLLDLYVTNFYLETFTLYVNQGEMMFLDATRTSGLAAPTRQMVGWSVQAIDFNLDGRPELVLGNGHIDDHRARGEPWKMRPQLFRADGGGKFTDVSQQGGDYFQGEYLGRGLARLDWDRDGVGDCVVVHQDHPVALLSNESMPDGKRLAIELVGRESNREAINARIRVTAGGRTQTLEICGGDGFFSSNEKRQYVGLGAAAAVDELEVRWPTGKVQRWKNLPVDRELILVEGEDPVVRSFVDAESMPEGKP